jgi:6-phosphogluconolactonase (cycloisomerase 2 family)
VAQLIVNDGTLDSPPTTVTITVVNLPPVANAGPAQSLVVRQTVQLDGSGSSDPDGDPLTFRWALTTRPEGSQATLTNATLVNPTFVADIPGTYVAQLIVNDGTLDSPPATVTITVVNLPPVANAGLAQSLVVRQTVQLDGSGSSDPNGDPLTFQWTLTTRPVGSQATLTNATAVNPTFVADVPGTYVTQLIVNDGTLDSPPATVAITVVNPPPVANAGPDQSLLVKQLVQLDGSSSSDPNGDPLTFQWTLTRPPRSNATLANATTAQPTFQADIPGAYTVGLIVNDGTTGSAPDTVTITATLPQPGFAYVANTISNGISSFAINAPTGDLVGGNFILTETSSVSGSSTPQEVGAHPSGRFVYAPAGSDFDFVSGSIVFLVYGVTTNTETGTLAFMPGSPFRVGGFAVAVAVEPSGRFAYVVTDDGESGGSVTGFTIDPGTGALLSPPVPGSPFPTEISPEAIAIDPTARFAYVVNSNSNSVSGFTIDPGTGALTLIGVTTGGLSSPQAIAIDPATRFAYVVNSGSNSVAGFTIDSGTGALTLIDAPFTATSLISPQAIAIDPTAQFIYVINNIQSNLISGFTINATTGALTLIGAFPTGGGPQAVAVDPSGRFVYVAYSGDPDAITRYSINTTTGELEQPSTLVEGLVNGPVSIAITGF